MKTKLIVSALVALVLAGCQVPVLNTSPASASGKASLTISVQTHGFTFQPVNSTGRFVIPPAPTPGLASFVLHDPSSVQADIVGASLSTMTDIPPGVWDLTLTLKDIDGVRVLGIGTSLGMTLYPGTNNISVDVPATQSGTGRIDVTYNWTQSGINLVSYELWHETLSGPPYVITETAVPVTGADTTNFATQTSHFLLDVPSGSYRLVLKLESSTYAHPPITATAEVYDNVTSQATVTITPQMLSNPPTAPVVVSTGIGYSGYPQITWTAVPSTASGFQVYRDGVAIGTQLSSWATSYTDTSYTPGTSINYSVSAVNGFGESPQSNWPTFVGVQSLTITPQGSSHQGIQSQLGFTSATTPSNATATGVNWSSDNPIVGSLNAAQQLTLLGVGTVNVKATTTEAAVAAVDAASGTSDEAQITAEALVSTFSGTIPWVNAATIGPDGNLYVVGNSTVHQITPAGSDTNLGGQTYQLAGGIAVDPSGNIYVSDNDVIYKSTVAANTITTTIALAGIAGTPGNVEGTGPTALFSGPRGLAYNSSDGLLYVADTLNNRIRTVNPSTGLTANFSGDGNQQETDGPQINCSFNYPSGIVFDTDHNLYVADFNGQTIRKISGGGVTTIAGLGNGTIIDNPSSPAPGNLAAPWGLGIDGNDLFVGDGPSMIRRIRLPGPGHASAEILTVAGNGIQGMATDGLGYQAVFNQGYAVAAGPGGVVYVADQMNQVVRRVVTNVFNDIASNDPRFADTTVMSIDGYYSYLYTGDGYTGQFRVGTILLYTTADGNHGKLLVTGIDPDYGSVTGAWRVHVDYTTWDPSDVILSQGRDLVVNDVGSSFYLDMDAGVATIQSGAGYGDLYLTGNTDGGRLFNSIGPAVHVGFYQ